MSKNLTKDALKFNLYLDVRGYRKAKEAVLFIEGIGANLKGWDRYIPYFSKRFTVIRYDHPCAGKSLLHKGQRIKGIDFILALNAVLGTIDKKVHIVSYSLGGFIAFRSLISGCLEDSNHKKVKSLTIGAGFSKIYKELRKGFIKTQKAHLNGDSKGNYIRSLEYLYDAKTLGNKKFKNYLISRCKNDPDFITSKNFIMQLNACLNAKAWRSLPVSRNKIDIPLLLVHSKDDRIVDPIQTLKLKDYFRRVTVYGFSRGGHCFKDYRRTKFCRLIMRHIKNRNSFCK